MKLKLTGAIVALLPLAGGALAADKAMPTDSPSSSNQTLTFDALDANKDGRISMPEAGADPKLIEVFSSADRDGDGYLDGAEYDIVAKNPPKP